ncbi:hypothetical protein IAG41_14685 [Sphingomonas sp. JC676]|uniref:hypothetical protein n=1 Tax=Sphingomonas sp. JC676 TaxID=2768065 RepID=UPI0016584CC1|nr:hypothetical protein [Sphingomonas sp. JC676]MBC9033641.1 hypothetical protein [Sphingomonas sp. JC676]
MSSPLLAAITAGFLIASTAEAQDTATVTPASAAAPAQPVKEKKICRGIIPTGSMMAKRFCLTKTEWAEFNRLNDEDQDKALSKRINVVPPTTP